jgi:CheY-like chemotaxis protein
MIVGDQLTAGLQEIIKKYNFLHIKHERYQNASKYRPDLVVWADSHPAPSNSLVIPKNADFEICRTKMLEYMATHNSERKTLSVLLIDTNLEVVSIIKNMLSELGIKCTVANNRNYKDFISREYDAIILGAKMPIVSGKSLASYIKTINQNSRIIGIYDFDDDSEYFDDFLYPPISIEELRGILI